MIAELIGILAEFKLPERARDLVRRENQIFLVGNGGSSAIASHIANDLVKAGYAASALNDPATLTCLANDYGYEQVYSRQIAAHGKTGDLLVAISSSGRSVNILNAIVAARDQHMNVITLSGFDATNPIAEIGNVNFYIPSYSYGVVEVAHLAILHELVKP